AAAQLLARALRGLSESDLLRTEAAMLARRAEREIQAKHQPEWNPIWTVRTRVPGEEDPVHRTGVASPVLANALLVAPYAGASKWIGVRALDAKTGAVRWTSPIGQVSDMVMAGEHRLCCGTAVGSIIALDSQDGRVLYTKIVSPLERYGIWLADC